MAFINNVLVFPCGSEIGLELNRALKYSPHFQLYGASSVADHGGFVYRNYIDPLPMIDSPDFLPAFSRALDDYRIDFVFPAHDEVLTRMAGWAGEGLLHAELMAPPAPVCDVCRSKKATYGRFAGKLPIPAVLDASALDETHFPVFMKPDAGQGSRGAVRIDTPDELRARLARHPDHLVLEYLPGREYTVDCFTDGRGRLRFASGRLRRRISGGISVNSLLVERPYFLEYADIINRELGMRGPWFFQLREDADGGPRLLEIAPRIAGTSGLQRARGVNLPLLALYDRLGLDIDIVPNPMTHVEIDRALANRYRLMLDYDEAYIDLDETLVIGNRVNPQMARFIFQCRNRGVRVVLVTRHFEDPSELLARLRLDGLFDEVIWMRDNKGKSSVIKSRHAVFVDDSFAERAEVAASLGIPVFDPASLEALLDE